MDIALGASYYIIKTFQPEAFKKSNSCYTTTNTDSDELLGQLLQCCRVLIATATMNSFKWGCSPAVKCRSLAMGMDPYTVRHLEH